MPRTRPFLVPFHTSNTFRTVISGVAGAVCAALMLVACGPAPAGGGNKNKNTNGDPLPGTLCAVQQIFNAKCTGCHSGGSQFPDLRADALVDLVGLPSELHPDRSLVVPGDVAASFLFTKIDAVGADDGALMPQGGTLDDADKESVRAWIAAGASDSCDTPAEGEGEGEPPPLEPGGDISSHIAPVDPQNGYSADPPANVTGSCSTEQWWQFGNAESSRMHPGRACIACHTAEDEGPTLRYGGTVQQAVDDADDCRGVRDVLVEILDDATGDVTRSTTTNSAGNFLFEGGVFTSPYRVRLTLDGRTREMATAQTNGDCMTCHTAEGLQNAPGRIVAP